MPRPLLSSKTFRFLAHPHRNPNPDSFFVLQNRQNPLSLQGGIHEGHKALPPLDLLQVIFLTLVEFSVPVCNCHHLTHKSQLHTDRDPEHGILIFFI